MKAKDVVGHGSGWVVKGKWLIDNTKPTLGSLTPASVSTKAGAAQTFTAVYRDADGYANLKTVDLLVSLSSSVSNAIWVRYNRSEKLLYLASNAGTFSTAGCTPGSAVTRSNAQGTLNCQQTTVSGSGDNLTVKWKITPKSAFASATPKKVWMNAVDNAGLTPGKVLKGSWTISH
jgi:hypothetical protein